MKLKSFFLSFESKQRNVQILGKFWVFMSSYCQRGKHFLKFGKTIKILLISDRLFNNFECVVQNKELIKTEGKVLGGLCPCTARDANIS